MSSESPEGGSPGPSSSARYPFEKKKMNRACDVCRRRKVKCDGPDMPEQRCTHCASYNLQCTYVQSSQKRAPTRAYVERLESRLEKLEKLLSKGLDDTPGNDGVSTVSDSVSPEPTISLNTGPGCLPRIEAAAANSDDRVIDSDDDEIESLTESTMRLVIEPYSRPLFGKSSGAVLVQAALDNKRRHAGLPEHAEDDPPDTRQPGPAILPSRRPQFWHPGPWERAHREHDLFYTFPEDNLLLQLVDLYFLNVNIFEPLLNRPVFEASLADGLHLRDTGFGGVVMLVCAVGSRYSDDPRVYSDPSSRYSRGWKYFEQVSIKRPMLAAPRLHDLQHYCLCVAFLSGSSTPQVCWTLIGIGLRIAQDIGAHRKKRYNPIPTIEDELWKRAFWVLVVQDRFFSAALGRACSLHDEDFDVDLPINCDDEYWYPAPDRVAFAQPPGKPSKMSAFLCKIKLHTILGFALRTIYSIGKSKMFLGFVGHAWEQRAVSELDSALNKWVDEVPEHLRWDPKRDDKIFMAQSTVLHALYYLVQIQIHREFLGSSRKRSKVSFPSLAICTNAARSCSHLVDAGLRASIPLTHCQGATFTSAIVLLLTIYDGKRGGSSVDQSSEMKDIHACMAALKSNEAYWQGAGKLWDILYELASVSELPLPPKDEPESQETHRHPQASSVYPGQPVPTQPTTNFPGEFVAPGPSVGSVQDPFMSESMFTLPTYTDELGRMPIHQQMAATSSQGYEPDHIMSDLNSILSGDNLFFGDSSTALPSNAPGLSQSASLQGLSSATQVPGSASMDNAMALWASALSGFQGEDGNMYKTNDGVSLPNFGSNF